MVVGHDSPEPLVAFEQPVQRLQLANIFRSERPSLARPNEPSEPFAQASRLSRDVVEFSGRRLCPQGCQRLRWYELRLLQPGQQAIAAIDPVDLRINRSGHRIQEIQTGRVGNEYGGRALGGCLGTDFSVRGHGHLCALVIIQS